MEQAIARLAKAALADPFAWIEGALALFPLAIRHPQHPDYVVCIDGRIRGKRGWMAPQMQASGYPAVSFPKPGCRTGYGQYPVHRIVASAYLGLPLRAGDAADPTEVHHLDGRKGVNAMPNLIACTASENQTYNRRFGLASNVRQMARSLLSGDEQCDLSGLRASHLDIPDAGRFACAARTPLQVARILLANRARLATAAERDRVGAEDLARIRIATDACLARLDAKRREIDEAAEALAFKVPDRAERFLAQRERLGADMMANTKPGKEMAPGLGRCRLWQGAVAENGYSTKWILGRQVQAHVAAYFVFNASEAEIRRFTEHGAEKRDVRHACHVRHCIAPAHLSRGTRKQNMEDMERAGRNARGDARWNTLIPDRQVSIARWMLAQGRWTHLTIAKYIGASQPTVSEIAGGSKRVRSRLTLSDEEAVRLPGLPRSDRRSWETSTYASGERSGVARLTAEEARLLRWMYKSGRWSIGAMARGFPNASPRTCHLVARGRGYPGCRAFSDAEAAPFLSSLPLPDRTPAPRRRRLLHQSTASGKSA